MINQEKINYIQRSPHDKKNPFVMINKEMLRDPDLPARAKGLLCYLLSFIDSWKAIPEIISKDLKISIDVTYAILKEIIIAGYATREVERETGKFKSWNYFFSEFKISTHEKTPVCQNPEMAHNESEPVWQNPELDNPELANPGNGDTLKNEKSFLIESNNDSNKKQQHQTSSVVVVFFDCIKDKTDLSDSEKRSLMDYPEDRVIKAVAYCYHSSFTVKKTRIQALHWHCKLPEPLEYGSESADNEKFFSSLKKYDMQIIGWANISLGNDYIEFSTGQTCKRFEKKDPQFESKVKEILTKLKI